MKSELSASASLPEVHGSVSTTQASVFRRMLAFAGPAYLVSVGYMDPGNWATDLEGGARFGYRLLWVLVVSNLMAILLQTLAARLGIVAGRDLAQACRESYSRPVCNALWVLCEIAIAACDLAEVLGAAIATAALVRAAAAGGRGGDGARHVPGAVAFALWHPPDRGGDLEPDRHRDRLLSWWSCSGPSRCGMKWPPACCPA